MPPPIKPTHHECSHAGDIGAMKSELSNLKDKIKEVQESLQRGVQDLKTNANDLQKDHHSFNNVITETTGKLATLCDQVKNQAMKLSDIINTIGEMDQDIDNHHHELRILSDIGSKVDNIDQRVLAIEIVSRSWKTTWKHLTFIGGGIATLVATLTAAISYFKDIAKWLNTVAGN